MLSRARITNNTINTTTTSCSRHSARAAAPLCRRPSPLPILTCAAAAARRDAAAKTTMAAPSAEQRETIAALRARCEAAGQGHLLAGWDALASDEERAALARDVAALDFAFLKKALAASLAAEGEGAAAGKGAAPPPPGAVLRLSDADAAQRGVWRDLGLRMYAEGRAAVLLLAGGQGTRLGSALPKGCFDVGLPSHKPLFALQAERLLALQRLAAEAVAVAGVGASKKGQQGQQQQQQGGGKEEQKEEQQQQQERRQATADDDGSAAAAQQQQQQQQQPQIRPIRWLVMTSPATHAETVAAFKAADYWGLSPQQVTFFQQGTLPCLTPGGLVILESPARVARAPDGNGGLYSALLRGGALQELEAQGVEALDCYCVDNAAARVGDPEFLGYCAAKKAGMGARVVAKASAGERVGVFAATAADATAAAAAAATTDGGGGGGGDKPAIPPSRLRVLEYSELDPSLASAPGPDSDKGGDPYLFSWANICMHYFSVPWLRGAAERLAAAPQYHVARKAVPSSAASPEGKVSGVKLEQFVFDPLPWACEAEGGPGVALFEVGRAAHFAPVKNAEGADSPATARAAVLAQGAAWVRAAGGAVEEGCGVEVSPLVSYAGEGLEGRVQGRTFGDGDVVA